MRLTRAVRGAGVIMLGAVAVRCTAFSSSGPARGAPDAGVDAAESGASTSLAGCQGASVPGITDCGQGEAESCCVSLLVQGGTYERHDYPNLVATVSTFRLDRFEVTVGRFRRFVRAVVDDGWRPAAGSGKHAHLNEGKGISDEPGWDGTWTLAGTLNEWTASLACEPATQTWTPAAGSDDARPINCVTWFEAYAFCIWDGGFLPSDAEWEYAATGGNAQRVFPWSNPPSSDTIDCTFANYEGSGVAPTNTPCVDAGLNKVGTESPKGDGLYRQADLAGNVWEWSLDWYATSYVVPCVDCANLIPASERVIRGGSFGDVASYLSSASNREKRLPPSRGNHLGFRCARVP